MNHKSVTVIIPAYNEAQTITSVVHVARESNLINEVIVISDGSTDQTARIAREAGSTVFELSPNRGKAEAMRFGVSKTNADVIVFLDADLIGLTAQHIEQLILPVVDGACGMVVGIRDRGFFITALCHILPLIGGERAVRREIFQAIPDRFIHGFMVEPALNHFCRFLGFPLRRVNLSGLHIRHKYDKVHLTKAVVQYLRMSWQIGFALVAVRITFRKDR